MSDIQRRWLLVTRGPLEGQRIGIAPELSIGRAGDVDVQLIDKSVSRKHAMLTLCDDGQVALRDLGSVNGTWLGQERVNECFLSVGDRLTIGESEFVLRDGPVELVEADQIKLASGPAEQTTLMRDMSELYAETPTDLVRMSRATEQVETLPPRSTTAASCGDPLHAVATSSGWAYCPACGGRVA